MKVLLVNAGPHAQGNTFTALNEVAKRLQIIVGVLVVHLTTDLAALRERGTVLHAEHVAHGVNPYGIFLLQKLHSTP